MGDEQQADATGPTPLEERVGAYARRAIDALEAGDATWRALWDEMPAYVRAVVAHRMFKAGLENAALLLRDADASGMPGYAARREMHARAYAHLAGLLGCFATEADAEDVPPGVESEADR